jgi:peptidoglycan-associated lipoprotein
MVNKRKLMVVSIAFSVAMFAAGCKKKAPPPPPPPPPAPTTAPPPEPAKPQAPAIAQFSAEPTTIQRGQSSTLRWEVTGNISSVTIDNAIGTVQNTGNRRVFPADSTTYNLTATGPGGSVTGSVTVAVTTPPPPPPPPTTRPTAGTLESRLSGDVQDAYFDYDKSDVNGEARDVLTRDAAAIKSILAEFPNASIVVEGHCDERGSAEYNLGLGDRRASSAKDFLVQLGVPADRLRTISYGKERPQCTEASESCYHQNRRAHFSPGQ